MSEGAFYLFRTPESVDQLGPGMLRWLRTCVQECGAQFVKAGTYKDPRSLDQNAMFRGLCREIAEFWNANRDQQTTPEAVARDFKVQFGVIETTYSPISDTRVACLKSTADYKKGEMAALITAVLAWAAEQGIPISDPRMAA